MNLDSFPQKTSWSSVNQNFLLRGPAFANSWTFCVWSESSDFRWVSDRNAALLLTLGRANIPHWQLKRQTIENCAHDPEDRWPLPDAQTKNWHKYKIWAYVQEKCKVLEIVHYEKNEATQ